MKEGFRQSIAWLHTWSGVSVGWVLYFIFLTGTTGYFDAEIDRWMRPELPLHGVQRSPEENIGLGLRRLSAVAPEAERWRVSLPNRNTESDLEISWRSSAAASGSSGGTGREILDGIGQPVEVRRTGGGQLLYQMHYRLHYLDVQHAYWVVGFCSMFMLVAIVTGVIVHKKIFKDFFTFRPAKGQRSWLDAHNVLSVAALPFHLMITYSGLVFFMFTYMPLVLGEVYGFAEADRAAFFDEAYPDLPEVARAGVAAPLLPAASLLAKAKEYGGGGTPLSLIVTHPGDANAQVVILRQRNNPQSGNEQLVFNGVTGAVVATRGPDRFASRKVNDVLIGLHEGLFAGPLLRWLYFLSGLLGTAMIATGLVLWTVKRRSKLAPGASPAGLALVERLNVGTVIGLPIGIAAYFWANRLLATDIPVRGPWEANVMFASWGFVLLYAAVRPIRLAWIELSALAAIAYSLIPILNLLTSERHLGMTLPLGDGQGDWSLAGFDLTVLAAGAVFALISRALVMKHRRHRVADQESAGSGFRVSLERTE